jgi:hypothetical protein
MTLVIMHVVRRRAGNDRIQLVIGTKTVLRGHIFEAEFAISAISAKHPTHGPPPNPPRPPPPELSYCACGAGHVGIRALENFLQFVRDRLGVGVFQRFTLTSERAVPSKRIDDLVDAADVLLLGGHDDGVAGFVGCDGGAAGYQQIKVFDN